MKVLQSNLLFCCDQLDNILPHLSVFISIFFNESSSDVNWNLFYYNGQSQRLFTYNKKKQTATFFMKFLNDWRLLTLGLQYCETPDINVKESLKCACLKAELLLIFLVCLWRRGFQPDERRHEMRRVFVGRWIFSAHKELCDNLTKDRRVV